MDIITVLVVVLVYSAVATLVIELSGENYYVIAAFGFGPVGLILIFLNNCRCKLIDLFKYRIAKRSIIKNVATGEIYKCKTQEAYNFSWYQKYELVKRYATKKEYVNIPDVPLDIMEKVRVNCDNCRYNEECEGGEVRCKCDSDGYRTEFDKFAI